MSGVSFDLKGRVALVTGASSGLGRHIAQTLAIHGARVVLCARRMVLLSEVKAEIEQAGGRAHAVAMDVTDEASTMAAFDAAEAAFGPVDSVVASAGLALGGSAMGIAAEDFDRMVDVNLRGVFLTAREAARRMTAAGSATGGNGRIVLISSITSTYVAGGQVTYCATKAGVVQMGRVMAKDWAAKGINVNVICPGYIRTELNEDFLNGEKGEKLINSFPRRRLMTADVLDPCILHLCSDSSAQITGSVITIDDGQSL